MSKKTKLIILGFLISAIIFGIDLALPLGFAGGVPYVLIVLIAYFLPNPRYILFAGIVGSALTITGFFMSPEGDLLWKVLSNRFMALSVIWVTVFFCLKTKRSEDQVNKFKIAVEQSPASIVITDIKGNIEYVNPMFSKVTHYDQEEVVGKNPRILKSGEHRPEFYKRQWDTILSGEVWKGEIRNKDKEGKLFWESTAIAPIKTAENKITHFVAIKEDITEKKMLESKLMQLSFAVEQSLSSIMITDLYGRIEYVNSAFTDYTGYELDEVIGKTPRVLKSGKHSREFYKDLWSTLLSGNSWEGELCNRKKNGSLYWEYTCISPVKNSEGQMTHFLSVKLDYTKRKADEEKLEAYANKMELSKDNLERQVKERTLTLEEEKKTTILLKTIAEIANYEKTFDTAIEKSLKVICEYLGWEVGHAYYIGKSKKILNSTNIWHLEDKEKFSSFKEITEKTDYNFGSGLPGRVALNPGMAWVEDIRKDSNFPRNNIKDLNLVTGMAFPIILQDELLGILEFFSVRKNCIQPELKEVTQSIGSLLGQVFDRLRLNKMKNEFVSTAAHELRTPLTSIQGYSELLMMRDDIPDESRKEFLSYINKESIALTEIINDLLDLSRIESKQSFILNKKRIPVKKVFEESAEVFHRYADTHKMTFSYENPSIEWFVDKDKINQVLKNIYSNSIKYSPDGGEIETTVKDTPTHIVVSVKDQGIGMTPESLSNFFEKFYRVDASNTSIEGTGLGTTIMKTLVEAHDGSIDVKSEFGAGTEIIFSIPKTSNGRG